jgi:hypothetical protein
MMKYIAREWCKFTENELKDRIQPVSLAARQRLLLPLAEISKFPPKAPLVI